MFHPTLKIKIYQEDLVFGPGLVILMEHILVTESMKDACGEMGMSYSKGWKIISTGQKKNWAMSCWSAGTAEKVVENVR